jgi:hypothetical protein
LYRRLDEAQSGVDTEANGKILSPLPGSNLDHPVIQPVDRHFTDSAIRLTLP